MGAPIVASAAVTAASTAWQMYAQKRAGDINAQVARNNAELAQYQRTDALRRGVESASLIRQQVAQTQSAATAAMGANAIESTVGSMGNLQAASAAAGAVDEARVKAQAALAAWGVDAEISDLQFRAKQQERLALMGSIGTGLSGLGRIFQGAK